MPASPPSNINLNNDDASITDNYHNQAKPASAFSLFNNDNENKKTSKNSVGPLDTNNREISKNPKISICLDKWLKELKGHVLVIQSFGLFYKGKICFDNKKKTSI